MGKKNKQDEIYTCHQCGHVYRLKNNYPYDGQDRVVVNGIGYCVSCRRSF